MKIEAAVAYAGEKDFVLEKIEIADPNSDEILIEIAGVGICHTDLFIRDAAQMLFKHPAVLGHEGAGQVIAVGSDVSKVAVGDHVAITFRSCGTCGNCDDGPVAYCENFPALNFSGSRTDGTHAHSGKNGELAGNFFGQSSFATHCLAYESNVVKVAPGIATELAGPLGCGVQTGAGAILNSLDVKQGSTLLVCGGGPVGQSAVMAAKLRGCSTVILLEPQASRRDFALEHGATHVIDPATCDDVSKAVRDIVPRGLDYALDTTGLEPVIEAAIKSLKIRGAMGLLGLSHVDAALPAKINAFSSVAIRLIGIIEGDSEPDEFLPYLMEQHLAGHLPFEKMIKTYPLSDINRAIKEQHEGKCIKAVLLPGKA